MLRPRAVSSMNMQSTPHQPRPVPHDERQLPHSLRPGERHACPLPLTGPPFSRPGKGMSPLFSLVAEAPRLWGPEITSACAFPDA